MQIINVLSTFSTELQESGFTIWNLKPPFYVHNVHFIRFKHISLKKPVLNPDFI